MVRRSVMSMSGPPAGDAGSAVALRGAAGASYGRRGVDEDVGTCVSVTRAEPVRVGAGDDIEAAKYYDFDAEVLLEMVPYVDHYELYDE